jgi:stage IV sporulation protein FB
VLLAEPPPSQGDIHFSLLGFPVRIHPFFWLTTLLINGFKIDPLTLLLWIAAVVPCILLHELSHAVVMRSYGMNVSIVLHSFGGLAIPRGSRYGARQPGPWGQILISAAGPASGFILSALLVLILHYAAGLPLEFPKVFRGIVPVIIIDNHENLTNYLFFVFQISILWGLMNLLPILPLDGGQIAYQVFILLHPADATRQALILSIVVGGLMCFVAITQWTDDFFVAILFFWLTFSNFTALQSFRV